MVQLARLSAMLAIVVLLPACMESRVEDVSSLPAYKGLVGTSYDVVGLVEAYGIRKNSRAPVDYITLIPTPTVILGSEVGFRVPIERGSMITITAVHRTSRVFDPNLRFVVALEGTQLPVQVPTHIDLFRGNEGKTDHELNQSIYRKRQTKLGAKMPPNPSLEPTATGKPASAAQLQR